jgi:hypothetical protein
MAASGALVAQAVNFEDFSKLPQPFGGLPARFPGCTE